MSNLTNTPVDTEKIAEFSLEVKYRRPGNVVSYLPVIFEVFRVGDYFKAVPQQNLQTRILADVPNRLFFEIINGKICNYQRDKQDIIQEIAIRLKSINKV